MRRKRVSIAVDRPDSADLPHAQTQGAAAYSVVHHRDVNAATNLENMAVSSTVAACRDDDSGRTSKRWTKLASMKQVASFVPV